MSYYRQEILDALKRINDGLVAADAELARRDKVIQSLTKERDGLDARLKKFVDVIQSRNPDQHILEFAIRIDRRAAFRSTTPFEVVFSEAMKRGVEMLERSTKEIR